MAKRMHGVFRAGAMTVTHHKNHPGSAQRDKGIAGLGYSDANSATGVIAPADHHWNARQTQRSGSTFCQPPCDTSAFQQLWHVRTINTGGVQQGIIPVALGWVQPKGASRIGHIRAIMTGKPVTQIIFG